MTTSCLLTSKIWTGTGENEVWECEVTQLPLAHRILAQQGAAAHRVNELKKQLEVVAGQLQMLGKGLASQMKELFQIRD